MSPFSLKETTPHGYWSSGGGGSVAWLQSVDILRSTEEDEAGTTLCIRVAKKLNI